jgi:hypothetical protein
MRVEPSTPFGDFTNDKLRGICQEFNLKIGTRKQMLKKIEELKPKINFEFCDLETKKIQEICLSRGINPHQKRNRLLQALYPEKTKKGRDFILYATIGLAVAFLAKAVPGLVKLVSGF